MEKHRESFCSSVAASEVEEPMLGDTIVGSTPTNDLEGGPKPPVSTPEGKTSTPLH